MKIVRVNVSEMAVNITPASPEYDMLGGRGVTSKILSMEVNPKCHATGAFNKVVIAPGLLTGSAAPCTGRASIGAKSPLTGTIKESNVGGRAGQYLAGHSIKALIIDGHPTDDKLRILVIDENGARFEERPDLAGKGNYETTDILAKEYGSSIAVISIGPAGEKKNSVATIAVSDLNGRPSRHAGRGGMGAVLGSKGLKAIVISRPAKPVVPANNADIFKTHVKAFAEEMLQSKKALSQYGTAVLVNGINNAGGLPTRNFSIGVNEHFTEINGQKLYELCMERGGATGHPCSRGCAIKCSNIFNDAQGNYLTAGLEFETIALMGSNCGLNNLDEIAALDRLCDDLGIDTMEMGVTLAVAMEGGLLPFGDAKQMTGHIEQVAQGTLLGKLLGQGATVVGRVLGVERVPAVKGQGMSAYDPRAIKGTGVTYATSTMGADHTTGNCLPGRGGIDCSCMDGQVELSKTIQLLSTVCDILGMCIFAGPVPEMMPTFVELTSAFSGTATTEDQLVESAREILQMEVAFNERAGIGKGQNDLPHFFRNEPLPNNGLVFDVPTYDLERFWE